MGIFVLRGLGFCRPVMAVRLLPILIFVLGMGLTGVSAEAATAVAPAPPAGRQAKLKATISVSGFLNPREISDVGVIEEGSGYSSANPPTILAVSETGSGAVITPYIVGDNLWKASAYPQGSLYSDDLTLVVPPPHTDDLKSFLDNANYDVIELQGGVYYQNAEITRDLTIRGKGIGRTVISGGLLGSVLKITGNVNVRLEDLTIIDGLAESGGGIFNDGGRLTLARCEIKNCRAYSVIGRGGAIYNKGASRLTLIDSEIHHNAAGLSGGGISNNGISSSTLPAGQGSSRTASSILEGVFDDFGAIEAPSSDGPADQQFNSLLDTVNAIYGEIVEVMGEIKPMFVALGENLDVWNEAGMPTVTISNSRIYNNRVGYGVAAAKTNLSLSQAQITGYNGDAFGNVYPIYGKVVTTVTHPPDPRIPGYGGGIHNDLGLVLISDSSLVENEVETSIGAFGGAISSFFGVVKVTDSHLDKNRVYATTVLPTGGAIHSFASWLRVYDSTLNDNKAPVGLFLSSGGAVKSTVLNFTELRRCEMSRNSSGGGGGLANDYLAFSQVEDCTIEENSVTGIIGAYGGGIRNENGGNILIENSTIALNSAKGKAKGGGIYNHCEPTVVKNRTVIFGSTATIKSSTISGNIVDGVGTFGIPLEALGAGVYNGSSGQTKKKGETETTYHFGIANMFLSSSTIVDNVSKGGLIHTGGGLYNTPLADIQFLSGPKTTRVGVSVVEIGNNLFANNTPNDLFNTSTPSVVPVPLLPSLILSVGYNLESDGSGPIASPNDYALSQEARFITNTDPLINPLRFNGGFSRTHSLPPASPARDKGSPDDSSLSVGVAPLKDQRGVTRTLGGRRDIGAFEATPPTGLPDDYRAAAEELGFFEDTPASVPAPGVLKNDIGDTIRSVLVGGPSNGTVQMKENGSFVYTPAANFTGEDSFTYRVEDAYGASSPPITVRLTVISRLDFLSISPPVTQPIGQGDRQFQITFDELMDAADSAKHLRLTGSMSGPIPFGLTADGTLLTLTAGKNFQPNEILTVTLTPSLRSATLSSFSGAEGLQFRIKTEPVGEGLLASGETFGDNHESLFTGNKLLYVDLIPDGNQRKLDVVGAHTGESVWGRSFSDESLFSTGQSLAVTGDFGALTRGSSLASADLNGDGLMDVVVVSIEINGNSSIWLNEGGNSGSLRRDGALSSRIKLPRATDVALGDLDNDGDIDMVILTETTFLYPTGTGRFNLVDWGSRTFLNDGFGQFTATDQNLYEDGLEGSAVEFADFDGDGFLDMFVAGASDLVYLNDGTGHFLSNGQNLAKGGKEVALGDLNGDGYSDAIVADGLGLHAWLNDGTGQFTAGVTLNSRADGVAVGDMDGDGDLDVVTSLKSSGFQRTVARNSLWFNDGNGGLSLGQTFGVGSHYVTLGDADRDGDLDVLIPGSPNQIWLNSIQPVAADQNYTVAEDGTLNVDVPSGLTLGATKLNGFPLSIHLGVVEYRALSLLDLWAQVGSIVPFVMEGVWPDVTYVHRTPSQPQHGTLTLSESGSFTYVPDADFNGSDSFTYFLMDGSLATAEATVTITVTSTPDLPTGRTDYYPYLARNFSTGLFSTTQDAARGVLANDTDPEGDPMTVSLARPPQFGSMTLNPDGSFTYQANSTFIDIDSFSYYVSDGTGNTGPVEVLLGHLPIQGTDDYFTYTPGGTLTVPAGAGVLTNDVDPNLARVPGAKLEVLTYGIGRPAHGTLKINADGSFTYVPDAGYTGGDSFTYRVVSKVSGVSGPIASAQDSIRVKLGNTAPVANDDGPYTAYDREMLVVDAASGVLANDIDADGDPNLTATLVRRPNNGFVTLAPDGSFTYLPYEGFSGDDSFTYIINDGLEDAWNVATVSLRSVLSLYAVDFQPARHSIDIPKDGSLQVKFSELLNNNTSVGRLVVEGSQSGRHNNIFVTQSRERVSIIHPSDFIPGETVTVTIKSGLRGNGNTELKSSINWRFRIASTGGSRTDFERTEPGTTAHPSSSVVLGDLNRNGYPDAVLTNFGEFPTVLINSGNRTFSERQETLGFRNPAPSDPVDSILADFNGDGRLDLFASGTNSNNEEFRIGFNGGTGDFFNYKQLPLIAYPPGGGYVQVLPRHIQAGDFDGDGDVDLFGAGTRVGVSDLQYIVWIWRNDGTGNLTFDTNSVVSHSNSYQGGDIGDVDNDGDLDVYLVGFGGDEVLLNNGNGLFVVAPVGDKVKRADAVTLWDINGDGFLDVLRTPYFGNESAVFYNDGTGKFNPGSQTLTPFGVSNGSIRDLALGDLDGDQSLDLWQAISKGALAPNGDALWFGNAVGSFAQAGPLLGASESRGVALADLDNDGDLDVFVANSDSDGFSRQPARAVAWLNKTPPRAVDDSYPANGMNQVRIFSSNSILNNDFQGEGSSITAVLEDQPLLGTVTLNSNGSFTYIPGVGFAGTDFFTYRVDNGQSLSNIARVKIGNTAPVAVLDPEYVVFADTVNIIEAPGVLANDTDAENDPLTVILDFATGSNVSDGTLILNPDGSFNYRPNPGYLGPDSFRYVAYDGINISNPITVTLSVRNQLELVEVSPAPNAVSIGDQTEFALQFNHPINPSSVGANVVLIGEKSGKQAITTSVVGTLIQFQADVPLPPGELFTLVISDGLEGTSGERLARSLQYQFIAEAPSGKGIFGDSGQRLGDGERASFQVRMGDVDDDGDLDAVVVKGAKIIGVHPNTTLLPGFAEIWLNDGSGQYTRTSQELGQDPFTAVLGDVDCDGDLDLALGDGTLWLNNGAGSFSNSGQDLTGSGTMAVDVHLADADGDGDLDFFWFENAEMAMFRNDGAGVFTVDPTSVSALSFGGAYLESAVIGDLDGDGAMDIVVRQSPNVGNKFTLVWLNDGAGHFTADNQAFAPGASKHLALGDLDGDGDLDLFLLESGAGFVWLNDGRGALSESGQIFAANTYFSDLQLGDIDGDGDLDALISEDLLGASNADRVSPYLNDGLGNFTASGNNFQLTTLGVVKVGSALGTGDLNGDGSLDLFIGGFIAPEQVWFNESRLAPLGEFASQTITDQESATPFPGILVRGSASNAIAFTITLDDPGKGSIDLSSGFTGPLGGPYQMTATSVANAQTILRSLDFLPTQNRLPAGDQETTVVTVSISAEGTTRTATAEVTAISVNDAPLAVNDGGVGFTTGDLTPFETASVLANDVDPDLGSVLLISEFFDDQTLGTVTNLGDGKFHYDPGVQFASLSVGESVTDSFDYLIGDGSGISSRATVTITIEGENQLPVAIPDELNVMENAGTTVITDGLLTNDTDDDVSDQFALLVNSVDTTGTAGVVELLNGSYLTYQPQNGAANLAAGATSVDTFTYHIVDPSGGVSIAPATVTVRVTGVADAPIAVPDTLAITQNTAPQDLTALVKLNDSDPDPGQTATLVITGADTALTSSQASVNGGTLTYDPGSQFDHLPVGQIGTDTFRYQISDTDGLSAEAEVTVTVTGVNDAPYALNDLPGVNEGSGDTDLTAILLANDLDLDDGETASLAISAVDTTGTAGTVTFTSGTVLYRPDPSLSIKLGEVVTDSFSYTVRDLHGATGVGQVSVSIVGLNNKPVADPASFAVQSGGALSEMLTGSDVEGSDLVYAEGIPPANGVLNLNSDGSFAYTPNADYLGPDSFTFTVNDGEEASLPATVSITVIVPPVVTTTADSGVGSLRQVIAAAPAGSTITFDASLSGQTILLTTGQLSVDKNLTIDASALADGITIDGNENSRIFVFTAGTSVLESLTLSNGNASGNGGGAILLTGDTTLTVNNSTLANHSAGYGGSIFNENLATLMANNCTIAQNTSTVEAGAIYNRGTATFNQCTIVGNNSSPDGNITLRSFGGIFNSGEHGGHVLKFTNCIVGGNSGANGADLHNRGALTFAGANLLQSAVVSVGGTITGSPIIDAPLLAPLGNYGGPTPTMPPLPGSPAIEGGVLLVDTTPLTDQRGNVRPSGPLPDIGAVEAGPWPLEMLADTDDDGIPDLLEGPGGPYPHLTVGVDNSGEDTDGDGMTDAREIGTMTNLYDPEDSFRVLNLGPAPGFDPITYPMISITFTSFPGFDYEVVSDDDLDLFELVPGAVLKADDFTETLEVPMLSGASRFWRVGKR